MKLLLVAVDFSPLTPEVLRTAVQFARAADDRIQLIAVVWPLLLYGAHPYGAEDPAFLLASAEKEAARKLDALVPQIAGYAAAPIVAVGIPADEIVREARERHADVIIIGSHGHGTLHNFVIGSTAAELIKKSPCPVLLVPPKPSPSQAPVQSPSLASPR